jgi:hypothetical protein
LKKMPFAVIAEVAKGILIKTDLARCVPELSAAASASHQPIDRVHARRPPRGILLDMDSSVSPTHGEQENSSGMAITIAHATIPVRLQLVRRSGTLFAAPRQRPQRRWLGRRSEAGRDALQGQGVAHLFPR